MTTYQIIGSLGWYLDIEEWTTIGPTAGFTVGQHLERSYSVPLPFDVDQVVTIEQFVNGIQGALDAKTVELEQQYDLETDSLSTAPVRRYEITAQPADIASGFGLGQEGAAAFDEVRIKYIIECVVGGSSTLAAGNAPVALAPAGVDAGALAGMGSMFVNDKIFKIKFVTGEHGSTENFLELGGTIGGSVEVYNAPVTEMAAFPFYSKVVIAQDDPPTAPHVEIIPYREVNNKILILANGTTGTYYEKPAIIEDIDAEHFINSYMAQGGQFPPEATASEKLEIVKNTPILFRSDDPTAEYQMFRIDFAPSSYQDFAEGRKTDIIEYISEDQISSMATYIDTIRPNTKYYYCFRAIDVHEHLSNPTAVYQVEMVDNNGQIYPIIESYSFKSIGQQDLTKSGKRFIYITPSTRQTFFQPDSMFEAAVGDAPRNNLLGNILDEGGSGTAPDQVWDNIYKIRLTSKKTGRKLDLNITFKNTGQRNP